MAGASGGNHGKILLSLILGAATGVAVNFLVKDNPDAVKTVAWIVRNLTKPIGDIFIHLLYLAILPLVFASLAVGVSKLGGSGNLGRVGVRTIGYFVVTTAFAAAIGLTMVNAIRPGDYVKEETKIFLFEKYAKAAADKLKNAEPVNLINWIVDSVPKNPLKAAVEMQMLAIIVTALLVGFALTRIDPKKAIILKDFFEAVNEVADFIIRLAMKMAPLAVFCLLFSTTAELGFEILKALGAFVFTTLAGLAIHMFIVLPLLVYFLGGMNPFEFFNKIRDTLITAFSTSSSSATLPTAIKNAEEDLGIPPPVARFVLPLSASMNHNGTALFEGVTVMFLCQLFRPDTLPPLTLADQFQILFLCILTATGMAGVPGGSLPLIGLILKQYQVPEAAIGIVIGVDRILDMCRTTVNVAADMTTTLFVSRGERNAISADPQGMP